MATMTLDKHEVDLTKGPIFPMLIKFAIPFIIANLLSRLFHSADIATLRFMVNGKAVAAVSATGDITNLFINFFIGFSAGASIVLSKCVGAKDIDKARHVVGTAMSFSLIAGVFLMMVGWFGAETFLTWMGCPKEIVAQSTTYVRIYFLGAPIILFYNLGAGMLRAVGDSVRPMLYLMVSGVANVVLNVFFIAVFNMTVEGVAIGTVASQLISSIMIFIAMRKSKGYSRLEYKYLKIRGRELGDIIKIGLPTGVQNSLFSLSNVIVQSTINTFGAVAIEGSGASTQIDGIVYGIGNSIANASMSFISQNVGARDIRRVKKTIWISILTVVVAQLSVGLIALLLAKPLLSIFSQTEGAYYYGRQKMLVYGGTLFLCGIMNVMQLAMRAMGKSTTSMILSLFFACVLRIVWLKTIFFLNPTFMMIFLAYPVTWIMNIIAHLIIMLPLIRKLTKEFALKKEIETEEVIA